MERPLLEVDDRLKQIKDMLQSAGLITTCRGYYVEYVEIEY